MNDDEKLKLELRQLISKVARIDPNIITDNSSLRKDLWIDSLQAIQIVALIEGKYNIKIDEVEIFNVETIIDIINLIKEYQG